jgi:hypothetical protein
MMMRTGFSGHAAEATVDTRKSSAAASFLKSMLHLSINAEFTKDEADNGHATVSRAASGINNALSSILVRFVLGCGCGIDRRALREDDK